MSYDGQNEIRISEADWCAVLARIAKMERNIEQAMAWCEAAALSEGIYDRCLLDEMNEPDDAIALEVGGSISDPKWLAWFLESLMNSKNSTVGQELQSEQFMTDFPI